VADRPHLPNSIRRAVLVEAGHRCAIPTCREHPVEVAHIEPRKGDGSNDVFENLIALCPTCHTRHDKGEVDRPAMRQYKANLSVVNSRYGDVEKRVLEFFADDPGNNAIQLPGGFSLLLRNLIKDGLLEEMPIHSGVTLPECGHMSFSQSPMPAGSSSICGSAQRTLSRSSHQFLTLHAVRAPSGDCRATQLEANRDSRRT
jgi:HNH endonuclease